MDVVEADVEVAGVMRVDSDAEAEGEMEHREVEARDMEASVWVIDPTGSGDEGEGADLG